MIFGVLFRVILEFCRRRGMNVPDLSKIRRRQPRLDIATRVAGPIAAWADDLSRKRATRNNSNK